MGEPHAGAESMEVPVEVPRGSMGLPKLVEKTRSRSVHSSPASACSVACLSRWSASTRRVILGSGIVVSDTSVLVWSTTSLRHYSATELIAAGVDVRTFAGRLGHGGGLLI